MLYLARAEVKMRQARPNLACPVFKQSILNRRKNYEPVGAKDKQIPPICFAAIELRSRGQGAGADVIPPGHRPTRICPRQKCIRRTLPHPLYQREKSISHPPRRHAQLQRGRRFSPPDFGLAIQDPKKRGLRPVGLQRRTSGHSILLFDYPAIQPDAPSLYPG